MKLLIRSSVNKLVLILITVLLSGCSISNKNIAGSTHKCSLLLIPISNTKVPEMKGHALRDLRKILQAYVAPIEAYKSTYNKCMRKGE